MSRGVYIVANDRVADQAIALLSSLRLCDPEIPVVMIPFNDDHQKVSGPLMETYDVQLFPDLGLIEKLTNTIADIFPRDFLKLPNKMRKLSAWFGPFDEFAYIDTDILLFESIESTLTYLNQADFVCCDFHHKGRGLSDVFSSVVVEQEVFTSEQLTQVFNSGFWASRKEVFTLDKMTTLLKECAAHREYFDFSSGTTDQPILNYLILKGAKRCLNITQANPNEPGSWGGTPYFRTIDHRLYDGDRALRYLHWAGTPLHPGGPYWDLWHYYRFRNVDIPLINIRPPEKPSLWKRFKQKINA